jgi:hypothetical protein
MYQQNFFKSTARALAAAAIALLANCTQQAIPLTQSTSIGTNTTTTTTACALPSGTLTLVSPTAVTGTSGISVGQTVTWGISMSCAGNYSAAKNGVLVASGFSQYTTYTTTYPAATSAGSESITVTTSGGQTITVSYAGTFAVGGTAGGLSGCNISISPSFAVIGPLKPTATFQVSITGSAITSGTTTTTTSANCNYVVQNVTAVDMYQQNVPVQNAGQSGSGGFGVTIGSPGSILISVVIMDPSTTGNSTTSAGSSMTLSAPVTVALAPSCQLSPGAASVNVGQGQTFTLATGPAGTVSAAQVVGPMENNPLAYPVAVGGGVTGLIATPTAGTFTYKGQVAGTGGASSVVVECSASFTVNTPAAPTCSLVKQSDNTPPGQPVTFVLTPTSAAETVLHSAITSINPNTDLGASGGSLSYVPPSGVTTMYAQVVGPGGTGNCTTTVSTQSQQLFTYPRCPNGYVVENCSQNVANMFCQSQGYSYASTMDVKSGTKTVSDTPCDCRIDSATSAGMVYHVESPACNSRSYNRCNSITCNR